MPPAPVDDHRSRTAAQRREKMRRRLVETALELLAMRGAAAVTIDAVIRGANVSRGSFYNYFTSTDELIRSVSDEIKGAMLAEVIGAVQHQPSPAASVAAGLATLAATMHNYPQLGRFMQSLDVRQDGPASAIAERFPQLLREGVAAGQFVDMPPEVMIDLITGCIIKCGTRTVRGEATRDYVRQLTAAMLRGLGLPPDEAITIADVEGDTLDLGKNALLAHLISIIQAGPTLSETPETI